MRVAITVNSQSGYGVRRELDVCHEDELIKEIAKSVNEFRHSSPESIFNCTITVDHVFLSGIPLPKPPIAHPQERYGLQSKRIADAPLS